MQRNTNYTITLSVFKIFLFFKCQNVGFNIQFQAKNTPGASIRACASIGMNTAEENNVN